MDYTKLKNAELETMLKERNLPHTGKKAEMVQRLQDDDKQKTATPSTSANASIKPSEATTAPAAAALAAGGKARVANPVAVPNQIPAEDPSKTSDLSVTKDDTSTPAATTSNADAKPDDASIFKSNLAATDLDAELEKRKARAKKFGIVETENESTKNLERAKRFGVAAEGESAALSAKLDAALPERGDRKRGRGGAEGDASRESKRPRGGAAPSAPRNEKPSKPKAQSNGGDKKSAGWMNDKDREAAEKRKARFAATASATAT